MNGLQTRVERLETTIGKGVPVLVVLAPTGADGLYTLSDGRRVSRDDLTAWEQEELAGCGGPVIVMDV